MLVISTICLMFLWFILAGALDEKINLGWFVSMFLISAYMLYDKNSSYLLIAGLFAIAGSITGCGRRLSDAMKEKDKKKDA